jgi:hypothetical protein
VALRQLNENKVIFWSMSESNCPPKAGVDDPCRVVSRRDRREWLPRPESQPRPGDGQPRPDRGLYLQLRRALDRTGGFLYRHSFLFLMACLIASASLPLLLASLSEAEAQPAPVAAIAAAGPGIERPATGNGVELVTAPANRDPAQDLVETIVAGDFSTREAVACGAFLQDFDRDRQILFGVDFEAMKLLRRGRNWVVAEAPYRFSSARSSRPGAGRGGPRACVRFVKTPEAWKVENVEVIP